MNPVSLETFLGLYQPSMYNTWEQALAALTQDCEAAAVIDALTDVLTTGGQLRPVLVDNDIFVLLDGQHRIAAHVQAGISIVDSVTDETELATAAVHVHGADLEETDRYLAALRSMPAGTGWIEAHEGYVSPDGQHPVIHLTYALTAAPRFETVLSAVRQRLDERGLGYSIVTAGLSDSSTS